MRLHRLRLQAFQAFGGEESVDFDALSDAGLFLLRGETGAGKTTLLDAVCFALYGVVPGTRAEVGRLRSDHADAAVRTEVELEATLRGTRVRVWRAPKQERPKVRGSGLTEEQHQVRVRVLDPDGSWRVLASRVDEARLEVERLVGMTATQFCQVVLLPQGRFAEFLRARSEDRRVLLEQLFETQRFADAEEWLKQRADAAGREADEALGGVRDVVARVAQVAGADAAPEGWEATPEGVRDWAESLAVAAAAGEALAAGVRDEAAARSASIAAALADARALAATRARWSAARDAQRELESRREARDAAAAELSAARRAAPVAPLLAAVDARAAVEQRAAQALATRAAALGDDVAAAATAPGPSAEATPATGDLATAPQDGSSAAAQMSLFGAAEPPPAPEPEVLVDVPRDPWRAAAAALRAHAGEVRALAPVEARLGAARDEVGRLEAAAARHEATATAASGALERAREQRAAAQGTADASAAAAARLDGLRAQAQRAREQTTMASRRDTLAGEVAAAAQRRDAARGAAIDAKARWLDLRERRLAGMAHELAGQLRDGEPCAVCGSTEHPAPAAAGVAGGPADGGPGDVRALEREAAEQHERCEAAARESGEQVATLERELAAATAVAGDGAAEELAARAAALDEEVAATERQAAAGAAAAQALERLDGTIREHEATCAAASREAATARATASERRDALGADAGRIAAALGGEPDVAARAQRLEQAADRYDVAADARDEHARARRELAEALEQAVAAARGAGFGDPDAARAAVREQARQDELEGRLQQYDDRLAAVRAQLEDPELRQAAARPRPDVPALEEAQQRTDQDERIAVESHALAHERIEQLTALRRRLDAALGHLAPRRERARRLRDLARLVDGTSSQNARRMRLSAYVLAARLEEIAAAASERLTRMSAGRYTLVHCDEGHTQRGRAGLELRVVDGWTGDERHPGTLSGGETFLASLALALGLADVVAQEAGGARLETLFVDEGFGSLDERALDEVLDVLDRLRDGGRVVGIVSHVAELRHRIPAQLHVIKDRGGSSVAAPQLSPSS